MKNDVKKWFENIERLCYAEKIWAKDELPAKVIQTHISVVLLGKRRVLKLKKPVDFGFLDYTTLEKRRLACEMEVALNSRLCPEIYLGTRAIFENEKGDFRLSVNDFEAEKIVEYGVWMNRLPAEKMLDQMVADNTISEKIVSRIAEKLSNFHKIARRSAEVDEFGKPEIIRLNWQENFEQTARFIDRTISKSDFELIRNWVNKWIEENEDLLYERIKNGKICDGHGDVRCESISAANGICIFDCIEFNERFRCADTANEAAFLAMDLDAYGRPDLGFFFFETYAEKSADEQIFKLFPFYRSYRAFVRGKVLSFQLDEPEMSEEIRNAAKRKAENYFRIAADSVKRLKTPAMILLSGLSGTGKTSVARSIAGELGLRVISSDAVRLSLFGDEKKATAYGIGKYDEESNELTYQKMFEQAVELLKKDGAVILDATFRRAAEREKAKQIAENNGALFRLIECRLSSEQSLQRLKLRAKKADGLSDADAQIYERQKADFDFIETNEIEHLILDTEKDLPTVRRQAADWLRKNS